MHEMSGHGKRHGQMTYVKGGAKMITEDVVVKRTVEFLEKQGWRITNKGRKKKPHGIDIKGHRHGRSIWIEAKGDRKRRHQAIHNSFPTAIGQVLFRMNEERKYRYYGIAIPCSWESAWKKKIKKMAYAWKLLGIRIYLIHSDGYVELKNWRKMLK